MRCSLAEITEVNRTATGDAVLRLFTVSGKHCPTWLIIKRPPDGIEESVGVTLEITVDKVYILGTLWARRSIKDAHEIKLATKGNRCVT